MKTGGQVERLYKYERWVAKQRDRWLRREVAISMRDGWLSREIVG
jgi:hypothetical protein